MINAILIREMYQSNNQLQERCMQRRAKQTLNFYFFPVIFAYCFGFFHTFSFTHHAGIWIYHHFQSMRPRWGDKYREADRQGAMGAEWPHSWHRVPGPAETSHQDVGARYLLIIQSVCSYLGVKNFYTFADQFHWKGMYWLVKADVPLWTLPDLRNEWKRDVDLIRTYRETLKNEETIFPVSVLEVIED